MAGSMSKAGVYSFGISREYYKKVYVPQSNQTVDEDLPGPGTYDMQNFKGG